MEEGGRRRSGRVPTNSYRMPSQMKSMFFGEGNVKSLPKNFVQVHSNPNIFLIRNFLSNSELDYFDSMCSHYETKFKASFTDTESGEEIISDERTSKFIHLTKSQDKFVRGIEQKSSGFVGLNPSNVEPLQIVSYGPGQQFTQHHDAGTLLPDGSVPAMSLPRRLITFFLYLNSLPEGEGHTEFPILNLSIRPERNSALLFCNCTLDINVPDPLVVHCARPLSFPIRHPSKCHKKWGLNIWLSDTDLGELVFAKTRTPMPAVKLRENSAETMSQQQQQQRKNEQNLKASRKRKRGVIPIRNSEVYGEGVLVRAERLYNEWRGNNSPCDSSPICGVDDSECLGNEVDSAKIQIDSDSLPLEDESNSPLPASVSQAMIIAEEKLRKISQSRIGSSVTRQCVVKSQFDDSSTTTT